MNAPQHALARCHFASAYRLKFGLWQGMNHIWQIVFSLSPFLFYVYTCFNRRMNRERSNYDNKKKKVYLEKHVVKDASEGATRRRAIIRLYIDFTARNEKENTSIPDSKTKIIINIFERCIHSV